MMSSGVKMCCDRANEANFVYAGSSTWGKKLAQSTSVRVKLPSGYSSASADVHPTPIPFE